MRAHWPRFIDGTHETRISFSNLCEFVSGRGRIAVRAVARTSIAATLVRRELKCGLSNAPGVPAVPTLIGSAGSLIM